MKLYGILDKLNHFIALNGPYFLISIQIFVLKKEILKIKS